MSLKLTKIEYKGYTIIHKKLKKDSDFYVIEKDGVKSCLYLYSLKAATDIIVKHDKKY